MYLLTILTQNFCKFGQTFGGFFHKLIWSPWLQRSCLKPTPNQLSVFAHRYLYLWMYFQCMQTYVHELETQRNSTTNSYRRTRFFPIPVSLEIIKWWPSWTTMLRLVFSAKVAVECIKIANFEELRKSLNKKFKREIFMGFHFVQLSSIFVWWYCSTYLHRYVGTYDVATLDIHS
jgi:hypothetical protein